MLLIQGRIRGRYKAIKEKFFNRKKYAALILQAVVDPNLRFMDVDICVPSGLGDWNAFKASAIYQAHRAGDCPIPPGRFLLADAGYYSHELLVTPYSRMRTRDPRQLNFNFLHARARSRVECAFGVLKMRFPRLSNDHALSVSLDFVPSIVLAACILHNICRENSDTLNRVAVPAPEEVREQVGAGVVNSFTTNDYDEALALGGGRPDAVQWTAPGEWTVRRTVVVSSGNETDREAFETDHRINPNIADEVMGVNPAAYFCAERRDAIARSLDMVRSWRAPPQDSVTSRLRN